jgi:hypothetical protein
MDEMLVQPANGGNCMLWVLCHLTDNLRQILDIVGGPSPEHILDLRHYGYGSEPITGFDAGLPTPEQLLVAYDTLHHAVVSQLGQSEEVYFDQEVELWAGSTATRGWYAFFFSFHHSYHIGQLELLRNLAGHTEHLI